MEELGVGAKTQDEEKGELLTLSTESLGAIRSNEAVIRFDQLCCDTKELFSRVQRLPPYTSDSSKWKSLFFRAFTEFDQLWKYQQERRDALDLRRSQIGEIGSQIAQLYLNYYLRTSQPRFAREAFSFYEAILRRDYFEGQSRSDASGLTLAAKKLRVLSRAVQVSLFLEDFRSAQDFLARLTELLERESGEKSGEGIPDEFHQVPSELDSFISTLLLPIQEDAPAPEDISPFHALSAFMEGEGDAMRFCLGPVVLVGCNLKQYRLLDFTVDHYRMFCFLKRVCPVQDGTGPMLVHMHRLSAFSLLESLASLSGTLPPSHVMLLYLSAQSLASPSSHNHTANSLILPEPGGPSASFHPSCTQQLFLEDLYPYLRRPLLLIIDSPAFLADPDGLSFPSTFRQPLICLVAPSHYPTTIENRLTRGGGLLTLFICSPLLGLCLICGISSLTSKLAHKALGMISRVEEVGFSTLSSLPNLPPAYAQLCTDQTIQVIIKRFLLFYCCLRLHLGFKKEYHPTCFPAIPPALFHSPSLLAEYFELFTFLDVSEMFMDISHALDL